jgi:hypothetical protein
MAQRPVRSHDRVQSHTGVPAVPVRAERGALFVVGVDADGDHVVAEGLTLMLVAGRAVLRPLQLTGLDRGFDVRSSVADALPRTGRHLTSVPTD